MRSSEVILALVVGAVLFSLTKLYSASTSFSFGPSSLATENAPAVMGGLRGGETSDSYLGAFIADSAEVGGGSSLLESVTKNVMWQQKASVELLLRQEVGLLEKQKQVLLLSVEELKLKHERSARRKAIDIAQAMITRTAAQASQQQSLPTAAAAAASSAPSQKAVPLQKATPAAPAASPLTPETWCKEAAARFGIQRAVASPSLSPSSLGGGWGTMEGSAYRQAWTAHGCDLHVFRGSAHNRTQPPQARPATAATAGALVVAEKSVALTRQHELQQSLQLVGANGSGSFAYLKDNSGRPRRRVTVLVWNKIRGFLDWLRADFLKDAKEKCSTECVFTDSKAMLSKAQGVLFHAKTHSLSDFPRSKASPHQKFMMVSLEQPAYAPLMRQPNYLKKFDYTLTYDLDSTIPIITIHPQYSAQEYYDAPVVPWHKKKDAAVLFTSNCKNAGAETRLKYVAELMKHFEVHSYGRCLKNRDEPARGLKTPNENKRLVLSQYKWYLALENNVIKDYVSEKVFDGLLAGSVPVYHGAPTVDKLLPSPHAVVKTGDFKTAKDLAAYLTEVGQDKAKYEAQLAWKSSPKQAEVDAFQRVIDMTGYKYTSLCRICHQLASEVPE